MATLKLPFTLERPSSTSPVANASDIDITTIEGLDATTVQRALELLYAISKIEKGASDIGISPITGLDATTVQRALELLYALASKKQTQDYKHKPLTEEQMSDLAADDAEEGIIYMSLEGWDGTGSSEEEEEEEEDTGLFGSTFGFTFGGADAEEEDTGLFGSAFGFTFGGADADTDSSLFGSPFGFTFGK